NVGDTDTFYQDYCCAFPYEGPWAPGAQTSIRLVNYGHRGAAAVSHGAPALRGGPWSASHWVSPDYDELFAEVSGAPSIEAQTETAGEIETILHEEVPFVVPYFIDFISVTVPNFTGLEVTGMGHFSLLNAGFTD